MKSAQVVSKDVLQRGQYGEVYVLASTLCKYDLRKGELFVLSWACDERVWGVFHLWWCVVFHCFVTMVV